MVIYTVLAKKIEKINKKNRKNLKKLKKMLGTISGALARSLIEIDRYMIGDIFGNEL